MTEKIKTFDELMSELDALVTRLESEDLNLDDAIRDSEEALELINQCRGRLETAKQKIDKLVEKSKGSWTKEALDD